MDIEVMSNPKAEAVRAALSALDVVDDKLLKRPEITHLPSVLEDDELPARLVRGSNLSVTVATDRRIIVLHQSLMGSSVKKVESFPYSEIAFITAGKGFLDAPLEVVIEGKARRLEADKSQRYAFAEFVAGKLTPRNDKEDTPSKEQRIDRQWFAVMPKGWGGSSDSTIHRGERKMLYDVLDEEGEGIEALVGGTYRAEQDTNRLHRHQGVAVATSKRVLFLDKGILGSKEVSEIPYRSIEAITHSTGMFYGGIQIMGLGRASFRIEDVRPKESAKQFADCVRSLVESLHAEDSHRSTQNVSATSLTEELGKLAVLFRDGSITQSEFDEAKRQLLEHQ